MDLQKLIMQYLVGIGGRLNNQVVTPVMRALVNYKYGQPQQSQPQTPSPTPTVRPSPTLTMTPRPTVTPTAMPTTSPTPTPQIISPLPNVTNTPTPTPNMTLAERRQDVKFNPEQITYAKKDRQIADTYGVNPDLLESIHNNESSLRGTTSPNINPSETSYGPFQINLKAHPEVTKEQASDYDWSVNWTVKNLKTVQKLFPNSIERQILHHNSPTASFRNPNTWNQQQVWYVANALKHMGKEPSSEFNQVFKKFGFQ